VWLGTAPRGREIKGGEFMPEEKIERQEVFYSLGDKETFPPDAIPTLHPAGLMFSEQGKTYSWIIPWENIRKAKINIVAKLGAPQQVITPQQLIKFQGKK